MKQRVIIKHPNGLSNLRTLSYQGTVSISSTFDGKTYIVIKNNRVVLKTTDFMAASAKYNLIK